MNHEPIQASFLYGEFAIFNPVEFDGIIGIWEQIHNPDFKGLEFETFRRQAGLNSFVLTPTGNQTSHEQIKHG